MLSEIRPQFRRENFLHLSTALSNQPHPLFQPTNRNKDANHYEDVPRRLGLRRRVQPRNDVPDDEIALVH